MNSELKDGLINFKPDVMKIFYGNPTWENIAHEDHDFFICMTYHDDPLMELMFLRNPLRFLRHQDFSLEKPFHT